MHDDAELTRARAHRVLTERVIPASHGERAEVEVAWHPLPGEPVPPAEALALDYTPYEVGTPWGPPWGTTWFRVTGRVPQEWAGRQVELLADLGFTPESPGFQAEALAYRPDGSAIKGVHPRSQHVPIAKSAQGGEDVELYLEAASNPVIFGPAGTAPTPEGDLATASTDPLYRTRTIELAVFEEEAFELARDLEVLLQLEAELPPGPRKARIQQGLDDALDALDLQDVAATASAARAVLAPLLAAPASASEHRISAVGHSHIDSAWLWPVRETVRKVARTSSSMTELIDASDGDDGEEDDFIFGMSSAQQYDWLKQHRPEVFERVRAAVARGRFLPLGGMWVESDTVMPTGEALVRQLVYGQRFFEREFGVRCAGVWLPDSFGYSPALPQLIRGAGFEWFFTQKISWNQTNPFPHHTFWWEGIDGTRVLTHFPPMDTYNSELTGAELARASRQFRDARAATGSIAPVGYGDGGGGTTREMLGRARRLADLEGSPRVTWEHPDAFFERARAELDAAAAPPVWVGELYLELHRATLTSQHATKKGNRRCEWLLAEAELWWAHASVACGAEFPYEELAELWRKVLLQQFHDILPGSSIAWVHREAVANYLEIERAATALCHRALALLTGEGDEAIVANPAAAPLGPVAPGGALARFDVEVASQSQPPVTLENDDDAGFLLANGLVSVRVARDGTVISARDLATGHDVIAPGRAGNEFQLFQDLPNFWDAWDVDRHYRGMRVELDSADLSLTGEIQHGRGVLTLQRRLSASSSVRQLIVLEPGSKTLTFETAIDWHETEKILKVAFGLDVRADATLAETQFGYQRRVTHANTSWEAAKFETSMHRYVLACEESAPGEAIGAALVNNSLYGYDAEREVRDGDVVTTLRLSLLRAPRFPDPATDQGRQTMVYGLVIGADVAAATAAGALLNSPRRNVRGAHGFEPLVELSGAGVQLGGVTLAHDRSGDLVVRVYEGMGRRSRGSVLVRGDFAGVDRVNLLEESLGAAADSQVGAGMARIPVTLRPFEVATFRLGRGAA